MAGKSLVFISQFFLIAIFSLSAFSQQPASTVTVTVKDPTGAPIAGATATLSIRGTKTSTAVTGDDGAARFENVGDGERRITIDATGFATVIRDVTPQSAENAFEITLSPGSISENVTVTAARREISTEDTAAPVSVIDREEIERKNINTIGDLFRTLPGTSTNNEGAFQVRPRIRGLESNRVLILVDGERLNNSRTSTGQSGIEPGLIENSQIQTVEVVRGSGSVLYGTDALAGTINIITRDTPLRREDGFRIGGVFNGFFTSNETGRRGNLEVNGSNNWMAFKVAQSLDRFDNYFTGGANSTDLSRLRNNSITVTDEGEILNSQSHSGNTQGTLRFFINDTNTLKLNYERRRGADIGSAGLVDVFNGFFPFSNRDKFNVRYDIAGITENLQGISVKAFYQTQYRNFTNILTVGPVPPFFPGVYQFSETLTDTKTAGFDVQTNWLFGKHNVVAGTSFFKDDNTDRRLIVSSTTASSPNRTVRNSRSVPDASLSNIGFFAQDDYRLTSKLRLIGGVRYDRFKTTAEQTTNFVLDPRFTAAQIDSLGLNGLGNALDVTNSALTGDFGVVYTIIPNLNVSARIGRSFRTPNISERFFTDPGSAEGFLVGNPNLVPETGINFDSSVKFRIKNVNGSVTYFNNYYKNFLATDDTGVFLPQPPRAPVQVFQTRNILRARIQGFESELEAPIRISFGYLTPYGNFSYLRGDNEGAEVLAADRPLNFISPFRTNLGFRWQNFGKNYYFDYNARIVSKQDRLSRSFIAFNGGPEAGFVTHNVGGGYYFRRERYNLSVNAGISNFLGRYYSEQFVTAPARGRSFTIGTTLELK